MIEKNIDFDKVDMEAAGLCKTDLSTISAMLEYGAGLIERTATKPREADKARQFKNMIKKLKKKIQIMLLTLWDPFQSLLGCLL